MNLTIVIAQALGIILTVSGVSVLINKKGAAALIEGVTQSHALMWLYGFVVLSLGAVVISLNNLWTSGLHLLITVIGWLAFLKGLYILLLPSSAVSLYRKWNRSTIVALGGLVSLIVGLILLYKGFV